METIVLRVSKLNTEAQVFPELVTERNFPPGIADPGVAWDQRKIAGLANL